MFAGHFRCSNNLGHLSEHAVFGAAFGSVHHVERSLLFKPGTGERSQASARSLEPKTSIALATTSAEANAGEPASVELH
jgi:hypothetical protein